MKRMIVAFGLLIISGCAALNEAIDGLPPPRRAPEVVDNQFEPVIEVLGVTVDLGYNGGQDLAIDTSHGRMLFRSFVDRETGRATHQLYFDYIYGGDWIFWERANDDQANPLGFQVIDREVRSCYGGGCSYRESFGISLTDEYIRRRRGGFEIMVFARDGSEQMYVVSSEMIEPQLAVLDQLAP